MMDYINDDCFTEEELNSTAELLAKQWLEELPDPTGDYE